jgi:hypothetical protein
MPATHVLAWLRGRRPEASREGTRGVEITVLSLWGFDGSAWSVVTAQLGLVGGQA